MNIFKDKIGRGLAKRLAKRIPKEDFLSQLKEAWAPEIKKNTNPEELVSQARARIKASGLESTFDSANITDEDLLTLIKEIQDEKSEPIRVGQVPKRNDPCPCGSGKKYKKCCGA